MIKTLRTTELHTHQINAYTGIRTYYRVGQIK